MIVGRRRAATRRVRSAARIARPPVDARARAGLAAARRDANVEGSGGTLHVGRLHATSEKARRTASASASCDPSPTAISVDRSGLNARRWKPLMSRTLSARKRSFGPDRHVAVRMSAVQQLCEHAVGDAPAACREAAAADAGAGRARDRLPAARSAAASPCRDELEAAIEKSLQRRQADDGGVVPDVGLELCADPARALRGRRAPNDRRSLRRACPR